MKSEAFLDEWIDIIENDETEWDNAQCTRRVLVMPQLWCGHAVRTAGGRRTAVRGGAEGMGRVRRHTHWTEVGIYDVIWRPCVEGPSVAVLCSCAGAKGAFLPTWGNKEGAGS